MISNICVYNIVFYVWGCKSKPAGLATVLPYRDYYLIYCKVHLFDFLLTAINF